MLFHVFKSCFDRYGTKYFEQFSNANQQVTITIFVICIKGLKLVFGCIINYLLLYYN